MRKHNQCFAAVAFSAMLVTSGCYNRPYDMVAVADNDELLLMEASWSRNIENQYFCFRELTVTDGVETLWHIKGGISFCGDGRRVVYYGGSYPEVSVLVPAKDLEEGKLYTINTSGGLRKGTATFKILRRHPLLVETLSVNGKPPPCKIHTIPLREGETCPSES